MAEAARAPRRGRTAALAGALGALALAAGLAACAGARRAAGSGFAILQINDTYKIEGLRAGALGGLARVRTLRRELEAAGRPVLVLHAGDLLFPSVMSRYTKGAAMIAALNRLDGDDGFDDRLLATFGNHEFDARDRGLLVDRLAESRFRWLSANLRFRPSDDSLLVPMAGRAPNVAESSLLAIGGIRVGIFGLSNAGEPRDWIDYGDFERRVEAARRLVRSLRGRGAELIVALTHQELAEDVRLAERVPGIDRIVGGHEHVALEREVGECWITKADADAATAVVVDVVRAPAGIETSHRLVALDASVPPDPDLLGEVARWLARLDERVREATGRRLLDVVAATEHALEGIEPAIRGRETALGNFLADTLRERLATDLGLVNGGSVRINDDVPAGGELRVYELEGIFYYDEVPVAYELTGAELLDLLRKSVSGATLAHGRFLQVAGLRYRYRAAPGAEGEATRVEAGEVEVFERAAGGYRPLDPARVYTAASNGWLWANGCRDGYPRFGNGCGAESPRRLARDVPSFRALTEEAIARLPGRRIRSAIDGRIVRVEEPAGARGSAAQPRTDSRRRRR
jgi:5'-nucleotidase